MAKRYYLSGNGIRPYAVLFQHTIYRTPRDNNRTPLIHCLRSM
jgi:hypothetical protein